MAILVSVRGRLHERPAGPGGHRDDGRDGRHGDERGALEGVRSGEVPLRILPGSRCDEHARSQATAPFAFRLTLQIGRKTATVPLPPPRDVQVQANELLDRACG